MSIFKAFKGFKKKSNESVDLNINNPIKNNHEEDNHNQIEDTINWTVDDNDYENVPEFNISDDTSEEKIPESYSSYDEYIRKNPTTINNELNSDEIDYKESEPKSVQKSNESSNREFIEPFELNKDEDEIQVAISKKPEITNHVNTEVGSRLLDSDRYSKEENNKKILNRIEDRHIQIIYQEVTKSSSQWDFFERLEKQQIPLEFLVALKITFEGVIENYRILKARQLNVHSVENDSFIKDMIAYDTYSEETRKITEKLKEHTEQKENEIKDLEKESISSSIKTIFEDDTSDIIDSIFTDDEEDSFDGDVDIIEDIDFDSIEEDEETKKIMEKLESTILAKKQEKDISKKEDTSKEEDEPVNLEALSVLEQLAKQIELDKKQQNEDVTILENEPEENSQKDEPNEYEVLSNNENEKIVENDLNIQEQSNEPIMELPEDILDEVQDIPTELPEDTLEEVQDIPTELPEDNLDAVINSGVIKNVEEIEVENHSTEELSDLEIDTHLKDNLIVSTKDEKPMKEEFTKLDIPLKKEEKEEKKVLNIKQNTSKLSDTLSMISIGNETENTLNDTFKKPEIVNKPNTEEAVKDIPDTDTIHEENDRNNSVLEVEKEKISEPQDNPIIDEQDTVSIQNPKTQTKNIFVVSEYALLPNIEGYKFIKVNTIKDIYKYSSSGQNLLVLTTEIPKELIKELGNWLKSIMKQDKKFRIVTLEGFEISHKLIEQTIKLNKVSLDAYYKQHPPELYKQDSIGSFKDLSCLFLDN